MGIGLGLYNGTQLLLDAAPRGENVEITTNSHGPEALTFDVPLGLWDLFAFYDPNGLPTAQAVWNGLTLFKGRMEDRRLKDGLLGVQALGAWRSLSDLPYTALWSTTQYNNWRALTLNDRGSCFAEMFAINVTAQLWIALTKNTTYTNAASNGRIGFAIPDNSLRNIVGVQFDVEMNLPTTFTATLFSASGSFSGTLTNEWNLAGTGALVTRSLNLTITSADALFFQVSPTANVTIAVETGVNYLKITNLRLVTRTNNRINTTLTVARTNGAGVTCTVGSTARMYVGQRLVINSGGANSESVIISSIPTSTTFTATIVNAPGGGYPIGTTVTAHVIYADEVALHMINEIIGANTNQLSSSFALVQSPGLDLLDETYEDASMADVLTRLAALGDTAGNMWEVGVGNDQLLFFRIAGSAGRTWYVDASDIDIERTIEALQNSVYAVYSDANGVAQRSSASADGDSVRRYGITRRLALSVNSTSSTQASEQVTAALADGKDPRPRAGIVFDKVYDAGGARRLLFEPQANDTIVIRNLPPALATTVDQIRIFRIAHTSYRADDDTLTVEPDIPRPTLEFLLARLAIGAGQTQITKLPVGLY